SVMDFYKEEPYMIRRSRGYAPLPVMMSEPLKGHVLAVGGELKNTFCIAKDSLLYQSPYVGDMEDIRTVNALRESITRMEELLEAEPSLVVCDLHPRYNTTVVAEEQDLPLLKIQHHFAHVLSCMAENDVASGEKVIGVSFDGTGYGTDDTIWGGEFLISDYSGFTRAASIMPFAHVGGDIASKEGFRIAASMIKSLYGPEDEAVIEKLDLCSNTIFKIIKNMAVANINTVTSTSCGRLFDAVSAILNIKKASTFEGEASTSLQFAADAFAEGYPSLPKYEELMGDGFDLSQFLKLKKAEDGRFLMATDELVKHMVDETLNGKPQDLLAYGFHYILAKQICGTVRTISKESGISSCALTGGCFQNSLLLKLCDDELTAGGMKVYRHSLTPPNDGGLALGQAIYGMYALSNN
ncbi:MAG: carbamoyltransferase HypF, partial [Lachnospiraceae bacterium]|nr:carbamoyltransferase HypF [Lachnospiraceae bacterium]